MPQRESRPNEGGDRCVCMSNTGVSETIRSVWARTSSARRSGSRFGELIVVSGTDERLPVIAGVGPAVVWHQRSPSGPRRILIVRVIALRAIEFGVFCQLLPVEPHTESGPIRHLDRPVLVLQFPALDDVVSEMV